MAVEGDSVIGDQMSKPDLRYMAQINPGELVLALGPVWVACTDALPWNDYRSHLRYVVYSPAYGGDMFICRFHLSGANWWHQGMQVGIGGVTHWRVADDNEQDFTATARQTPEASQPVDPDALLTLQRWWNWYAEYRAIEQ